MKVLLFLSIVFVSYLLAKEIVNKKVVSKINSFIMVKNDAYYNELLKYYEKNKRVKLKKKLNVIHKINILLDRALLKRNIVINPVTIILMCLACVLVSYTISKSIFGISMLSFIISVPTFFVPIAIISAIANYNENKIEKILLNFLLQLKNYTDINNDIIYAFKEVKVIDPLQSHINKFLIEINSGVKFEKAMEHMKEKIHIKAFLNLLNNIEYCYLYGGDFGILINKSYLLIEEMQKEQYNRVQETRGARVVLVILILLDLLVYFVYVNSNSENYKIMVTTFLGNAILYWNFISMWLLVFLAHNVKKLDY